MFKSLVTISHPRDTSAMGTIENRSKGLLRCVNAYKDFTKTTELILKPVDISDLIGTVVKLLEAEFNSRNITMKETMPAYQITTQADGEWIEQVLINVLKNSMEALEGKEDGRIEISASQVQGKTYIIVRDNGQGMDKTTLDRSLFHFYNEEERNRHRVKSYQANHATPSWAIIHSVERGPWDRSGAYMVT